MYFRRSDAFVNGDRQVNEYRFAMRDVCRSTPYSSTVVFLVRKGNPKDIKEWDDIIKPDVEIVVVAHPGTSGVTRWAYLAGWGYVLKSVSVPIRPFDASK